MISQTKYKLVYSTCVKHKKSKAFFFFFLEIRQWLSFRIRVVIVFEQEGGYKTWFSVCLVYKNLSSSLDMYTFLDV